MTAAPRYVSRVRVEVRLLRFISSPIRVGNSNENLTRTIMLPGPVGRLFLTGSFIQITNRGVRRFGLLVNRHRLLLPGPNATNNEVRPRNATLRRYILNQQIHDTITNRPLVPTSVHRRPNRRLTKKGKLGRVIVHAGTRTLSLIRVLFLNASWSGQCVLLPTGKTTGLRSVRSQRRGVRRGRIGPAVRHHTRSKKTIHYRQYLWTYHLRVVPLRPNGT